MVSLALGFGMSQGARAADPGEVEELIRQGVQLRREGSDTRAMPMFKKAYDLAPTPRTAAQLGLVEMALGYQMEAERHLSEGLASPKDIWIRKHSETLEKSLQTVKAAIGQLVIQGSPAGADVLVNGARVGKLPLPTPVRVSQGPSTVKAQAAGFVAETQTVNVTGGRNENVTFNLRRTEPAEASRARAPSINEASASPEVQVDTNQTEEPQTAKPAPVIPKPSEESRPPGGTAIRTVAWVSAATAVAALGFGTFEILQWHDKLNQFDTTTKPSPLDSMKTVLACGTAEPNRGSLPVCQTLYDDLTQAKTFAIVGFVVGGALAVGSVALFVVSSTKSDSSESGPGEQVGLICAPFGAMTGVACGMSF